MVWASHCSERLWAGGGGIWGRDSKVQNWGNQGSLDPSCGGSSLAGSQVSNNKNDLNQDTFQAGTHLPVATVLNPPSLTSSKVGSFL